MRAPAPTKRGVFHVLDADGFTVAKYLTDYAGKPIFWQLSREPNDQRLSSALGYITDRIAAGEYVAIEQP